jgi:hypothetical protein
MNQWMRTFCTCSPPLVHVHVLTTGSCCTLVLAPWFLCACSHYWFMLYICSRPLVHVHLFSLLVHVVHLFVPLGSWALVLTTVSCARVVTTGSCCTLVLAPWFMCTCSNYWFMLCTCSHPLVHWTTWTSSENKCTWTKGREEVYNMNQ